MMKKLYLILLLAPFTAFGQTVALDPTITPALFQPTTTITVTYDVTGTSLATLNDAWAWVWIPGQFSSKYAVNPATSAQNPAKFTKSTASGKTLFTISFKPSDFFNEDISTKQTMGILLKADTWANGQTTDYLVDFWDGSFQLRLTSPSQRPLFVDTGDDIDIEAEAPVASDFELFINNVSVDTKQDVTLYTYTHSVSEISGYGTVKLVATQGANSDEESFQYLISAASPTQPRPAGIISGINYKADQTKATVCLLAPGKSSAYVFGDFTNWDVLPQYQMKKDGEYFWIEISGLTPGQEYAFQYLVDESLYLADPYADKILDPDDQYIPATTYPNLKPFPDAARHNQSWFNSLAVLQTGQTPYNWQVTDFSKPAKEGLVIYELLVRDFFGENERNYQNLIDTIGYFKRLGINAIELMPIMEFNGNDSWGYNPAFMFAPDKYYGTKNKLKEFVDVCHQNGIAVILDIAMNHQNVPSPLVLMDFDFEAFKPNVTNKWFNRDATHPFNVFYDMNHESQYTKNYLDTVNYYWLNEYKVDGFRFDLSKGFTQKNNPNDVGAWSNYDASRIAILKRMADKIWSHTPEAYIILEHLAVNTEEQELADYRIGEGKGMMLWGKMTDQYNQATMGFSENSDFRDVYHTNRGWAGPRLVGYMESHDEERLMYKNLQSGKSSGSYNVRKLSTALSRMKGAGTLFYTIPGPKMLWEFGELGYDLSINRCPDGTIKSDCRVAAKPVHWDYLDNDARYDLFTHTADLLRLRNTYDIFTKGTANIFIGTSLVKQIQLKNVPYTATPASADDMNVVIVVNMDVTSQDALVLFPHQGTWYDYYGNGASLSVTGSSVTMSMVPGKYKLYTDFPIQPSIVTGSEIGLDANIVLYPNPTGNVLKVKGGSMPVNDIALYSTYGVKFKAGRISSDSWDVSGLANGFYVVEIRSGNTVVHKKIIKR